MTPKIWWYLARSTGIVAWALAAASVIWGLLLSTRSARGIAKPVWVAQKKADPEVKGTADVVPEARSGCTGDDATSHAGADAA